MRALVPARRVRNTGETDLEVCAVSRTNGMTMPEYPSRKARATCGVDQDAMWRMDTSRHDHGGCSLNMTPRDQARTGRFMQEDGAGVTPPNREKEAASPLLPVREDPDPGNDGCFRRVNANTCDVPGTFRRKIHVEPAHQLVIAINSARACITSVHYSAAPMAFTRAATDAAPTR